MRFAGDSMICAFLATEAEAATQDGGLAAATLRAVQCASDLAENLGPLCPLHCNTPTNLPCRTDRYLPRTVD